MTLHTPELLRQNEAHKAIQARLWGKREKLAPPLQAIINSRKPVDASYHVELYHAHLARLRETFTMASSFTVKPTAEYCPYTSEIVFEIDDQPMPRRSMKEITLEVLKDFPGIKLDDLLGPKRSKTFVYPRHMAMYKIWMERKDLSYPMIGRFFNRDHTSALFCVRKMRALIEMDPDCIAWTNNKKFRKCVAVKETAHGI